MLTIKRIALSDIDQERFLHFDDKTVFTTPDWLRFISESQHAEPVVLELYNKGQFRGYFTGAIVTKMGFRIFGSPFKGWTTAYMGFNVYDRSDKIKHLRTVLNYILRDLRCIHAEIYDRDIAATDLDALEIEYEYCNGYEINLARTEEAIFASFRNDIRTNVRYFQKSGCVIQEDYSDEFAREYYKQLLDVFAKQKMVPLYDARRALLLIRNLKGSDTLLCLKALSPEGTAIATAIFVGFNRMVFFWGGASYREHQRFRPNEALQWHAIRYWKAKGMTVYDMGGGGQYKEKYAGDKIAVPLMVESRWRLITILRNLARDVVHKCSALKFRLPGHRLSPERLEV